MLKTIKAMFKKIRDRDERSDFREFLQDASLGHYGTTKTAILKAAKERFGASKDWAAILALVMQYLPMILALFS